jgi:hypothetical protein
MHKIKKYAFIFGLGIITLPGLLYFAKVSGMWRGKGRCESVDDESAHDNLKETQKALEKAIDFVQSALNRIK